MSSEIGALGMSVPAPPADMGGGATRPAPAVPPRELARMLDQVPIGIVSLDADGRVRVVNRHAKRALGLQSRDMAGEPVERLFPGAEDAVGALLAGDRSSEPESELIRCTPPGGERWLDVVTTGFTAPAGDRITVLLLHDVTARVRAELAVRESHQLLSAVTEGTSDILFVRDDAGRYLMVNGAAAAWLGRAAEDCIGAGVADLFAPESAERLLTDDATVIAAEETREFEQALAPAGAEPRTFHVTESPYRDGDGQVVGVVGVARDITDRKRDEERLQVLAAAGALLSGSLDYASTLPAMARAAVPAFADGCVVDVLHPGDDYERLAVVHTDPAWAEAAHEVARRWGVATIDAAGGSRLMPDVDPEAFTAGAVDDEHRSALERLRPRSLITVALEAGGARPLGALTFVTGPSGRRLDGADLQLAEDLGRRAATAVAHARLHAERSHIASTLWESLLPPRLPVVPGARVASRFHAAGAAHQVGGDFYDLFPLSGGRFLLVIGDVCGKGAEAAAVTALARYTIRGSALREDSPARVLSLLSEALVRHAAGGFCSALCARIEPVRDGLRLVLASGGHPLPVAMRAGDPSRELGLGGMLLGVVDEPDLPECSIELRRGDTVVFYTDGVTDAGAPERVLEAQEVATLASPWAPWGADAVAARLEAAALAAAGGELRDDLALMVLELPGPAEADRIRTALPTGPKLARSVRAAVEPLRDRLGRQAFATVRLLVDELVANAERHGTPDRGAPIGLEVAWTEDTVRLAVSDSGEGFPPPRSPARDGTRGWGLLAVDRLARRWGVEREPPATVWVEVGR